MPGTSGVKAIMQGIFLGVAIVLPGLSGGTAALIMGLYHQLVRDFSHFRWRPYLPLLAGIVAGILGGARGTAWLLDQVPSLLAAFLLGVVLASAWFVFRRQRRLSPVGLAAWIGGAALAWSAAVEPLAGAHQAAGAAALPLPPLFLGGALAASAMMLPGMSGGTLLIMTGLYDDMLQALNGFNIPAIAVFGAGAIIGMFGVARAVSRLLELYPVVVGFFLAGMILGSARAVIPPAFGLGEAAAAGLGAALIVLGREKDAA